MGKMRAASETNKAPDVSGELFEQINLNERVPSILTTDIHLIAKARALCKKLGQSSVWFTHRSQDFGNCVVTYDSRKPVAVGSLVLDDDAGSLD